MKALFFSVLLLISAPALFAQTNIDKTIMVDGKKRNYIIHLPTNYQSLKNIPVIIALHGSGGKSEGTQKLYQLDPLADKYGYIVLYPQAIYKNWNIPGIPAANGKVDSSANDVQFISALIDSTLKFYNGDSMRVFLTGISRGGKFSLYLAYELNKRIRAIAPVCASIPGDMKAGYHFDKPIPVLLINGTEDPLVSYNGGYGKLNVGDRKGPGFDVLPTEELVTKLTAMNGCDSTAVVTNMPDNAPGDGCTAIKYYYKSTKAPVEFIKIIGGGHTWPGGFQYLPKFVIGNVCKDFSAADEIFNFFITTTK